jgi:hypothetical protein
MLFGRIHSTEKFENHRRVDTGGNAHWRQP